MGHDQSQGPEAFDRSRAHRRGVQKACVELEHALARPVGKNSQQWSADTAARFRDLADAFRHHAEQSEGPDGLLREIVESAPRLTHAVDQVKEEHEDLLAEMARLEAMTADDDARSNLDEIRKDALQLRQDIEGHRQRGADLIYEAYSVDVEGGEGG